MLEPCSKCFYTITANYHGPLEAPFVTPCLFRRHLQPTLHRPTLSLLYAEALAAVPIISQRLGPPTACLHLLH
eukprot:scaffold11997_cov86-Skeletonema_marinoi.AAC.1